MLGEISSQKVCWALAQLPLEVLESTSLEVLKNSGDVTLKDVQLAGIVRVGWAWIR